MIKRRAASSCSPFSGDDRGKGNCASRPERFKLGKGRDFLRACLLASSLVTDRENSLFSQPQDMGQQWYQESWAKRSFAFSFPHLAILLGEIRNLRSRAEVIGL